MAIKKLNVFILLGMMLMASCMDDDALWQREVPGVVSSQGVFIINEGNFMYNNASLSYFDTESGNLLNDVFFNTNGLPLGDVATSMTIRDNLGYAVVNNSGRIYIFDINTFEFTGKITGLTSPRYIHFVSDNKAYVSDLYESNITIINPQTHEITGKINVHNPGSPFLQHTSEQMVQYGRYLFVNSWSYDNKVLVIDTYTDEWIDTIEVAVQPQSMVLDKNNKLWVLSDGGFQGNPYGHEEPGLIRIDAATREIEQIFRFNPDDWPRSLAINGQGDTLWFINRHVFRHPVGSEAPPERVLESSYDSSFSAGYRAIAIDPHSSEIYLADAIDHVQPGRVLRFSPSLTPLDTLKVGIIPGGFCFR